MKNNIILIGMPGAGKSTVGAELAAKARKTYLDTDSTIREKENRELRDIVNEFGFEEFLAIQEKIILSLNVTDVVIATGGSVPLSEKAMSHLMKNGRVVYLKVEFDEIENRLGPGRRLARSRDKSLLDVYRERTPYYEKYAELTAECKNKSVDEIVKDIVFWLAV